MIISKQQVRKIVRETLAEGATRTRPVYEIASEIKKLWKNVDYSAKPYLDAMSQISSVADGYGADDGKNVVLYFLANATTWRGPDAKRLKDELKAALKAA